jgi:hypothetical protein
MRMYSFKVLTDDFPGDLGNARKALRVLQILFCGHPSQQIPVRLGQGYGYTNEFFFHGSFLLIPFYFVLENLELGNEMGFAVKKML